MDGADVRKILHAFKNVGQVPKHVLYFLRGAVSGFRKRAEGGNIGEAAAVEAPEVNCARPAFHNVACSLHDIGRDLEACRKIVCAAGRYVAKRTIRA